MTSLIHLLASQDKLLRNICFLVPDLSQKKMSFFWWGCLATTMQYCLLLKEFMLLSVYEHHGLNVQKVSWLPCQSMEFIVHFFFVCATNLAEFQLTVLYQGICMKACLGILDQVITELHTRVGEIRVYSVSSICRRSGSEEFYMLSPSPVQWEWCFQQLCLMLLIKNICI